MIYVIVIYHHYFLVHDHAIEISNIDKKMMLIHYLPGNNIKKTDQKIFENLFWLSLRPHWDK